MLSENPSLHPLPPAHSLASTAAVVGSPPHPRGKGGQRGAWLSGVGHPCRQMPWPQFLHRFALS